MAKYKLNHDVSVNGEVVLKVGDPVEGTLAARQKPDGGTEHVLMIQEKGHKVIIPQDWLDEQKQTTSVSPANTAAQQTKKNTPLLVWASPAAGLTIGLFVAKKQGGGTRNYIGWGFVGLMVGLIPTILYFRKNMDMMASAAAKMYGKKNQEKKTRASELADSISLINKTQNGKELDSVAKKNLQDSIEQQNFTSAEFKTLKEYITLSNAISIYGDLNTLSKDDQAKVQMQIKKLEKLNETISANTKLKTFVDSTFGSQEIDEEPEE